MKKLKKRYYADFETTQVNEEGKSRVYLWAISDTDYNYYYGYDLISFISFISKLENARIYFHNLGGWDFQFILYYLIENNTPYVIGERNGKIYSAKITFKTYNEDKTGYEDNEVEIFDSLNFLPYTLEEIGKSFNKTYFKTSIDYDTPYNHIASKEEVDYCINDVLVLVEGMENFYQMMDEIMIENKWKKSRSKLYKKQTISGIAFECFKESSGYKNNCENKDYDDSFIREAYFGGYVYSSPRQMGYNVTMIDNNSEYPYTYSSIDMPVGNAFYEDSEEELKRLYKFYIIKVYIKFELKKGFVPIIPGAKSFKSITSNYMSSSDNEYLEYTFTNSDFERIKRYYDVDYKFIKGCGFHTSKGFYKKFADILIKIKSSNKGAKRLCAKLLLNSPYGKLALNPLKEDIKYFIDNDGIVKRNVESVSVDEDGFNYIPQAVAITAGARDVLFTRCELIGWKNILYTDTDSVKYENPNNLQFELNDYELGAWKDEGHPKYFKTISPKKYCFFIAGENPFIEFTCAGFNLNDLKEQMAKAVGLDDNYIKENSDKSHKSRLYVDEETALEMIELFRYGTKIKCLQKVKVKDGVILKRIEKEIKQKGIF